MNLTHVRLLVEDFSACLRFYRDVLGLPVALGEEGGRYAELVAGPVRLALFDRALMADALGASAWPGIGADPAALGDRSVLILAVEDVDDVYAEICERGGEFIDEPHDRPAWFVRCVHLRDPEGRLIEINRNIAVH